LKIWTTLLLLILWSSLSAQTNITISGKIVDKSNGRPIRGATIMLKGNNVSTSSDLTGNFTLVPTARGQDTILIRDVQYVPVSRPILLGNAQYISVELLPKSNTLEEVKINTGYQRIDRRASTGSVATISEREIQYNTSGNLLDRIDGLISGAYTDRTGYNFNGAAQQPNLTIRGQSSLIGQTFPLIVVDNFPFEGTLENINPQDIETVTVLKDAAAASIWGVRAGNGVLVITTKKGKLNQPLFVDVSSSLMVSRKPDLFSRQTASSSDFIDMERFLFEKGFYGTQINDSKKPVITPVVKLLIQQQKQEISEKELEERLGVLRGIDVRNDFLNFVYRNAIESSSSIGLRGGGDKVSYSFSLGYNKNTYSMPTNGQDRITARFSQTYRPVSKLTLSTDLSFSRITGTMYNTSNMVGYGHIKVNNKELYPYAQLKNSDGVNDILYTDYDRTFIDQNQGLVSRNWNFVPLDELERTGSRSENQQIVAGLDLGYDLAKGLRFTLQSQLNRALTESSSLLEENSYYTRNLYNRFTAINGGKTTYGIPDGGIQDRSNAKLWGYSLRTQLDIDRQLGRGHRLQGIAGAEVREINNSNSSYRTYGVQADRNTFSPVDFANTYPLFPAIGGKGYIPNGLGTGRTANRYVSIYSTVNYSFADRYFLSASARSDASNIFGVDTRNKWSPLWSLGGGWEISGEPFYHSDAVNYLKIRSSFGYSGNVDASIPAELVLQQANYLDFYSNQPFTNILSLQNPGLRWERVQTFNAGIEWKMWNKRLDFTFDYYRKKSLDLIGFALVDPTLGTSSVTMNSAELKGQGLDLTVSTAISSRNWSWNGVLRTGYNRTTLEKYHGRILAVTNQAMYAGYFVGKDRNMLTSFRWDGLTADQGAPRGFENGEPSINYQNIIRNTDLDDLVYHGSSVPRLTASYRNRIGYRNLEFAFTVLGQFVYFFRKNSINYSSFFSNWSGHSDISIRWKKTGDELHTDVPAMYYPLNTDRETFYSLSEVLVRRGDHIRLQDIRLSYRFSNIARQRIRSLELFLMGTNMGLIWTANKEGIDPVSNGAIAPPLTLTGGFKIGF